MAGYCSLIVFEVLVGVSLIFSMTSSELMCWCRPNVVNSRCDSGTGRANCTYFVYGDKRPSTRTNYRCFYSVTLGETEPIYLWGCVDLASEKSRLTGDCLSRPSKREKCCNDKDYCNLHSKEDFPEVLNWTFISETASSEPEKSNDNSNRAKNIGLAAGSVVFFIVVVATTTVLCWFRANRHSARLSREKDEELGNIDGSDFSCNESSGRANHRVFDRRTISREVQRKHVIGKGRFGAVYVAEWRGRNVAVKIFRTVDEASFFREVELYNTRMLRHDNILGFVAADNFDTSVTTELWMVLDYHSNGSLYDFLIEHSKSSSSYLTPSAVHLLASTAVAGVAHLHMHIGSQRGGRSLGHKPSIAHRDLKSKNILVKNNMTCCVADLGMAIRHNPETDEIQHLDAKNIKVGTRRYLAPEVLDESINIGLFESFRCVDMYALALVLWEIAWCCQVDDCSWPYEQPFFNMVPNDPSIDDMYKVVCMARCRPPIPKRWENDELLQGLGDVIKTCYKGNPNGRLTAAGVKKRLQRLVQDVKSKP